MPQPRSSRLEIVLHSHLTKKVLGNVALLCAWRGEENLKSVFYHKRVFGKGMVLRTTGFAVQWTWGLNLDCTVKIIV